MILLEDTKEYIEFVVVSDLSHSQKIKWSKCNWNSYLDCQEDFHLTNNWIGWCCWLLKFLNVDVIMLNDINNDVICLSWSDIQWVIFAKMTWKDFWIKRWNMMMNALNGKWIFMWWFILKFLDDIDYYQYLMHWVVWCNPWQY